MRSNKFTDLIRSFTPILLATHHFFIEKCSMYIFFSHWILIQVHNFSFTIYVSMSYDSTEFMKFRRSFQFFKKKKKTPQYVTILMQVFLLKKKSLKKYLKFVNRTIVGHSTNSIRKKNLKYLNRFCILNSVNERKTQLQILSICQPKYM